MTLLLKLREVFRDKTREAFCARFIEMGMEARMSARRRSEEKITSMRGRSLGIIDLESGPIRWVNIKKLPPFNDWENPELTTIIYIEKGIPDPRLTPAFPALHVRSIRKQSFPLFGKVIGAHWKGKAKEGREFLARLIAQLSKDDLIRGVLLNGAGLDIKAYPRHGCWILTSYYSWIMPSSLELSRERWDCYQAIAEHLLSAR